MFSLKHNLLISKARSSYLCSIRSIEVEIKMLRCEIAHNTATTEHWQANENCKNEMESREEYWKHININIIVEWDISWEFNELKRWKKTHINFFAKLYVLCNGDVSWELLQD